MSQSLPRRWSLEHNPLSGITFPRWCKLLWDNRCDVDGVYAHRALFITAISIFNTVWAAMEGVRYGRQLRSVRARTDPIFVLGHWRSGTTHVHNLLACDDRLASPTTYQAVNPSSFLTTQKLLPRLFRPLLPSRRPMDDVAMSFDAPQEDELALALLSGCSPYLALSFPRRAEHYGRYLTFRNVPPDEVVRWKTAFMKFAGKLSFSDTRRMVFKSPAHTARIAMLLDIFPDARFVHIHRDPLTVFQSSLHYFDTAAWYANLQKLDPAQFATQIIDRYRELYDAYLSQRTLIPAGRLCEISYQSLVANPLDTMRYVYDTLALGSFSAVQPKMSAYLESVAGYRTNQFPPLSDDQRRRVEAAWQPFFQAFGYADRAECVGPVKSNASR